MIADWKRDKTIEEREQHGTRDDALQPKSTHRDQRYQKCFKRLDYKLCRHEGDDCVVICRELAQEELLLVDYGRIDDSRIQHHSKEHGVNDRTKDARNDAVISHWLRTDTEKENARQDTQENSHGQREQESDREAQEGQPFTAKQNLDLCRERWLSALVGN